MVTSSLALKEKITIKSQSGVAVVPTVKEIITWHYGCDFRQVLVLLRAWVFWDVSDLRCHQSFSISASNWWLQPYLLKVSFCNYYIFRQWHGFESYVRKGNTCVVTNSICYLCVSSTSKGKTYLDKTRQLATWLQVSPKHQIQTGFQTYSPENKWHLFCLLAFRLSNYF